MNIHSTCAGQRFQPLKPPLQFFTLTKSLHVLSLLRANPSCWPNLNLKKLVL